jgi:hypothetical protein
VNTDASTLNLSRFLQREPAEVYHAKGAEYLSSHALAEFRADPLLYRKKRLGLVVDRDRPAFALGRAAHTLILEGRDAFQAQYIVGGPVNPKTGQHYGAGTKAWQEWAERICKPVLTDGEAALVDSMNAAVRSHIFAAELLAEGVAERVARGEYAGHKCQARIDWINPRLGRGIVDLKTCDNLSTFEFDIRAYGYVHQLAFYRALIAIVTGLVLPVHIVAVEKREPFRCGLWLIHAKALDKAQAENEQAMQDLARCIEGDVWPTGYESIRLFEHL